VWFSKKDRKKIWTSETGPKLQLHLRQVFSGSVSVIHWEYKAKLRESAFSPPTLRNECRRRVSGEDVAENAVVVVVSIVATALARVKVA